VSSFEADGGWRSVLQQLTDGGNLRAPQAGAAMTEILEGRATAAQIAAFIVALRMKGETVDEVSGMVDAMLAASAPIEVPAGFDPVDIVGTGGSPARRAHAVNVSTMACLTAAGAGAKVLKHGNRRASSTSGSSDVLEALGVEVELDGEAVVACLVETGAGFCFARLFHPAMRHAGPVRAELGVPTVFNLLGPLAHPARVNRQVIGVSDARLGPLVAGVLAARGATHALVAHGHGATDELTTTGPTELWEVRGGTVEHRVLDATDLGLAVADVQQVAGGDPAANAAIARRVLDGEPSAHRDLIALNAAAGLYVAGVATDLREGLDQATAALDDGRAAAVLEGLRAVSHRG
jgi:anthranilate phosphoribosyltransferase